MYEYFESLYTHIILNTHFLIYCQIFTMEDDIVGLFIDIEFDCDLSCKWKLKIIPILLLYYPVAKMEIIIIFFFVLKHFSAEYYGNITFLLQKLIS